MKRILNRGGPWSRMQSYPHGRRRDVLRAACVVADAAAAVAVVIAAGTPAALPAATVNWINSGGGSYSVGGNWSSDPSVPGPGDIAQFNLASTYAVGFDTSPSNASFNVLQGDVTWAQSGGPPQFYSLTGGANIGGGTLTLGAGIKPLTVSVSGGTLNLTGGGIMNVNSGNTLSANTLMMVGVFAGNGTLVVDGSGSSLSTSATTQVGLSGTTGTLTFQNGATGSFGDSLGLIPAPDANAGAFVTVQSGAAVTGRDVTIASVGGTNQTATFTVTGASSTFTQLGAGGLTVGAASGGTATLSLTSGGTFTTGVALTTVNSTGHITVNGGTFAVNSNVMVNGGTITQATGTLTYGTGHSWTIQAGGMLNLNNTFGPGSLTVSSGGSVSSPGGTLDSGASSPGTATVNAGTWTNSGDLIVGLNGNGSLSVLGGGSVSGAAVYLGRNLGASGTATVSGAGSTLTCTADLEVGYTGSGTLTVQGGASASDAGSLVGVGPHGIGNVTITGAGSTWTLGLLGVTLGTGGTGTGTLMITNGGAVTASDGNGFVGYSAGGSGAATVSDSGSTWTMGRVLFVGYGGLGQLTIQNGADVSSLGGSNPGGSIGDSATGTGTATVTGAGSTWTIGVGLQMSANGGQSTLNITNSGAVTIAGNITDGGAGTSTLTLDGGTLDMQNHNIGGATPINILNFRSGTLQNVAQVNNGAGLTKTTTGTLTLDGTNTYTGTTTVSAGTLVFRTTYTTGSALDIANGATAQLANSLLTPQNIVLRTGSLNTHLSGQLDLRDNKLIVTAGTIGSWNGSAYTGLTGLIQSGRNGNTLPLWDGSGIITSQTVASGGNFHSIGIAKASDVRPATATATALWGGQTITGTDALVMYTYGGDATLDGKINIDDYVKIDSGIAGGYTGWVNGDFNYDGKVSIDDYITVIDANIGNQNGIFPTAGSVGPSGVVVVPEPGALLLLAPMVGLLRCRRRMGRIEGRT